MRMRRLTALIAALIATVGLAGCGSSYDEDGYQLVRDYIDEQIQASNAALLADEPTGEHADAIDQVNNDYWNRAGWPAEADIEGWSMNISQGDQEWELDGSDLADAVYNLEAASATLAIRIRDDEGDIDRRLQDVSQAIEQAEALYQP